MALQANPSLSAHLVSSSPELRSGEVSAVWENGQLCCPRGALDTPIGLGALLRDTENYIDNSGKQYLCYSDSTRHKTVSWPHLNRRARITHSQQKQHHPLPWKWLTHVASAACLIRVQGSRWFRKHIPSQTGIRSQFRPHPTQARAYL